MAATGNSPGSRGAVYADNGGDEVGLPDSELHPGLGRQSGTLPSERASTGEPSDESPEMPVQDVNPFRHKGV